MKKNDLKTGMLVMLENLDEFMVLKGCDTTYGYENDTLICLNNANYAQIPLDRFTDDLLHKERNPEFNIIKVSLPDYVGDIFRRLEGQEIFNPFDVIYERGL